MMIGSATAPANPTRGGWRSTIRPYTNRPTTIVGSPLHEVERELRTASRDRAATRELGQIEPDQDPDRHRDDGDGDEQERPDQRVRDPAAGESTGSAWS